MIGLVREVWDGEGDGAEEGRPAANCGCCPIGVRWLVRHGLGHAWASGGWRMVDGWMDGLVLD
jgi:hypothetical protein